MMKICKVIEAIFIIVSILFVLWAGISWIEIVSKNLAPNPTYSPTNFFTFMF